MEKPRIEDMPDKYEALNPDGSFRCYGSEKVRLFSNIELPTEQLTTIGTYGTLLEALKARTRLHSKATHHRKRQGQLGEKSPYKLSVRLEVIDKKTGKNLGKEIWGHDADKVCFSVLARRVNKEKVTVKTFEVQVEVIERHVIAVKAENEEQAKEKGREHGVESCNAYAVNVESLSAKEVSND